MTRDQWLASVETRLQGILLAGYVSKETDPAMLFRSMRAACQQLREALVEAHGLLQPAPNPTTKTPTPMPAAHLPPRNGTNGGGK